MTITLRIIQTFDVAAEREFLALERQFVALEKQRADFPQGKRYRPVSSALPTHTLIWEATFPTMAGAQGALEFMAADSAHENLAAQQRRYLREVRVELLEEF